MCGRPVIATAKYTWNNLPVGDRTENEARQKLFQKEFSVSDKTLNSHKFAIYAYEVVHDSKFECGFMSLNEGPVHCKLSCNITLGGTIIFEKNCLLKTFIGVHYFSFKKDGLLSDKTFRVSLQLDVSIDQQDSLHVPCLAQHFNQEQTSDLKVKCDGATFSVHKFVLGLKSDVLQGYFLIAFLNLPFLTLLTTVCFDILLILLIADFVFAIGPVI